MVRTHLAKIVINIRQCILEWFRFCQGALIPPKIENHLWNHGDHSKRRDVAPSKRGQTSRLMTKLFYSMSRMVQDWNTNQYHLCSGHLLETRFSLQTFFWKNWFRRCISDVIAKCLNVQCFWTKNINKSRVQERSMLNENWHPLEDFSAGAVDLFEICTTVFAESFRGLLGDCLVPLVGCPVGSYDEWWGGPPKN